MGAHGQQQRREAPPRCPQVVRNLRFSGTSVPPDYEKRVQRAIWTFQHQRVFCPRRCAVVHLHEVQGGSLAHNALVPAAAEVSRAGSRTHWHVPTRTRTRQLEFRGLPCM